MPNDIIPAYNIIEMHSMHTKDLFTATLFRAVTIDHQHENGEMNCGYIYTMYTTEQQKRNVFPIHATE